MDIARAAIEKRTITLVLTFLMLGGGIIAFDKLSRLEDPEFTIKEALVITSYPGASATEVEEEVSDLLEQAVQAMGQLDEVESRNERGRSTLNVRIKKKHMAPELPQIWDELRRKIGDAQGQLPPGAGPSIVVDDFGDVWGIFLAITGDDYSYAELEDYADLLRREILKIKDVAKIGTWGTRREVVYVELDRDRMARLGITTQAIVNELQHKNLVADAGRVQVGSEFVAFDPTGTVTSVEDFYDILITDAGTGKQIFLRDVAQVRRDYLDPARQILRYDGQAAIGLGISSVAGGNVVTMGENLKLRLAELAPQTPLGIEIQAISMQSDAVATAINGFVLSLVEAVAIVIIVLLIFMGLRSGVIIGFILVLTILGTLILMVPMGVALERISLGALIIALGMLVDNAIVVIDGMLVRIKRGEDSVDAASAVVRSTAIPLLGATIIAILAFAAIGTSQDSTGEFCRSLYQVILLSLSLSWVTAVTVTPLLGVMFLKRPEASDGPPKDEYDGAFYNGYRAVLRGCIQRRWLTLAGVMVMFLASLWGFRFVDQSFFPSSTRAQFMVDFWLPQGSHIETTSALAKEAEEYLLGLEGTTHVSSLIGQGGMRFLLTYAAEKQNSAYTQFLVDVDDAKKIRGLMKQVETQLPQMIPDAKVFTSLFQLGPGGGGKIQVRLRGPDPNVIRRLESEVMGIMHDDGDAKAVRSDWRQRVKVVRPVIAEQQASLNGITRAQVASTLREAFQGKSVGIYRDGDDLLPIVLRAPDSQRLDVASLNNVQIMSPVAGRMIPISQVLSGTKTAFEDEVIIRLDRQRTLTVHCDPKSGSASALLQRVMPLVEALEKPTGYAIEWGGEYEDSAEAQGGLKAMLPIFLLMMVLIVIFLFNSLRQPLIIWLTVPLALIGVTAGLLVTGQPFGFMALLGFLSLSGMLIKNAIVLIDQINIEVSEGKELPAAIMDSGVSRLRPVAMAALTTALGLIPLLFDAFFIAMAVTIISGLLFATVLTMVVVPVLYAAMFKVEV